MKNNELTPANSNELTFSLPNGKGTFDRGIDGRGNPYEKRTYENGPYIKQELLKNGEFKITIKGKP